MFRNFKEDEIKKIRGIYWLMMLPVLLSIGCNELTAPEPERLGYDYFPLIIGEYRVYDVKTVHYNLDGSVSTEVYQLKEVVADSSIAGGETSFRLDRYRRADAMGIWKIDSVWSARRNGYQAIVVENNVPIIKLSFPLAEDRRWDGNAMNSKDFDEFKIENLGMTYQIDSVDYPNSLQMFKEDFDDPINLDRDDIQLEVYSDGIGLILRQDSILKYCQGCPVPGTIEQGRIYEQKLVEIGKVE